MLNCFHIVLSHIAIFHDEAINIWVNVFHISKFSHRINREHGMKPRIYKGLNPFFTRNIHKNSKALGGGIAQID